jgi:hypothetical protein
MMNNYKEHQIDFFKKAQIKFGRNIISKNEALELAKEMGKKTATWFVNPEFRVARNQFEIPNFDGPNLTPVVSIKQEVSSEPIVNIIVEKPVIDITPIYVPEKDPNYVKFGFYNNLTKIVKSGQFYPVWIQGLSGNGKTMMVEQVSAALRREFFRINITSETDEDDLLGHYTLVDGQTVWEDGPVVKAMERGAILLIDEIDYATMKIACIQPVLEGKGVYLKKVNRWIKPVHGFNIIATANTKGKGSEDGRFIGTNIMNEAFLERFPITVEQEYPSVAIEKTIVNKLLNSLGCPDSDFATKLVTWSDIIRKTFYDGGVDEIIATRRLAHICRAYSIFGDRLQAIDLCINRFDDETKTSFRDLYTKVDADVSATPQEEVSEEMKENPAEKDEL